MPRPLHLWLLSVIFTFAVPRIDAHMRRMPSVAVRQSTLCRFEKRCDVGLQSAWPPTVYRILPALLPGHGEPPLQLRPSWLLGRGGARAWSGVDRAAPSERQRRPPCGGGGGPGRLVWSRETPGCPSGTASAAATTPHRERCGQTGPGCSSTATHSTRLPFVRPFAGADAACVS